MPRQRRCWYKIVGRGQGQVNVRGPRPGSFPVKLDRYLSKYITKNLGDQPREFEEHRYFCSLGIKLPIESIHLVLTRQANEGESKMFKLMFDELFRRIGERCPIKQWIGGTGTFGWISGFEDLTCRWIVSPQNPCPQTVLDQGAET